MFQWNSNSIAALQASSITITHTYDPEKLIDRFNQFNQVHNHKVQSCSKSEFKMSFP